MNPSLVSLQIPAMCLLLSQVLLCNDWLWRILLFVQVHCMFFVCVRTELEAGSRTKLNSEQGLYSGQLVKFRFHLVTLPSLSHARAHTHTHTVQNTAGHIVVRFNSFFSHACGNTDARQKTFSCLLLCAIPRVSVLVRSLIFIWLTVWSDRTLSLRLDELKINLSFCLSVQ